MPSDPGRETQLLLAAAQFLTRLPIAPARHDPDWLPRGAKYFPLVGAAVGCLAGAVLLGADRLWPAPLPAILAVVAALLVTGAIHEDGLADCADSLGGGSREARLAIMKDPRLGAFGALAIGACLALQAAALAVQPPAAAAASLVAAHAGGRLAAVLLMAAQPYGGDLRASRIEHRPDRPRAGEAALAAAFGLAPLLLLPPGRAALGVALGAAAAAFVAWRLCRVLGGHTGDVLGAAAVTFQTAFLLGAAAHLGP